MPRRCLLAARARPARSRRLGRASVRLFEALVCFVCFFACSILWFVRTLVCFLFRLCATLVRSLRFDCSLLWFVLRVAFVPFRLCEALAYFVFVLFVRYFGSFFAFCLFVTLRFACAVFVFRRAGSFLALRLYILFARCCEVFFAFRLCHFGCSLLRLVLCVLCAIPSAWLYLLWISFEMSPGRLPSLYLNLRRLAYECDTFLFVCWIFAMTMIGDP